jgi:hypothetical protein
MHIALATCHDLPEWEMDDRPLHQALEEAGVRAPRVVWNDPSVDWARFDACLIRTTWDYTERHAAYVAWADRVGSLIPLFNPAATVRWNTHKSYLRDLADRGVPTVPTEWLPRGSQVDLRSTMTRLGWRRGFLKPAIGATARHTFRFRREPTELIAAQAHLDRLLPEEEMLLQPYLESVEREGELSAVFIDGALSHAVRKVPVPGDYRVQDDFDAHDEPAALARDDLEAAWRAWRAAGADLLYGRADFLRGPGGRLLLTELELVEPSLFFRHAPAAAPRLAAALRRRVRGHA